MKPTRSLLGGRISTSDDGQRLVSEDWDGTVADRTGGDTALPVGVLSGEEQSFGRSSRGEDDSVGSHEFVLLLLALGPVFEGALGQVDTGDSLGDDVGTKSLAGVSGDLVPPRLDGERGGSGVCVKDRTVWAGRSKVQVQGQIAQIGEGVRANRRRGVQTNPLTSAHGTCPSFRVP